ncbi:MAG TPA: hypothetical protein PK089_06385 [Methanoregulaceae archaeon]|nr:hypothetical protein [Methanoregulaceae archaeon]HQJ87068.1 hypothetical protein [Methanoregulaceae archaeon]
MRSKTCWKLSTAALLVLSVLAGAIAGAAAEPVVEWESWLGGTGHDVVLDIQETPDGGYLLAGNMTPMNGTGDAYLVRIDANGTRTWEKTYGGPGEDVFLDIAPVKDGYVLVGTTAAKGTGTDRLMLIRIDANGTVLFETNTSGRGTARGLAVVEGRDGSFTAVGLSARDASSPNDIYLVRFDATGRVVWEKYYGGQGEDRAFKIVEASDGGFAIAGAMTPDGQTMTDAYLLKVDRDGNRAWEKRYGTGDRNEAAIDLVRTADGGYVMVGRSFSGSGWWEKPETSDVYVLRVDRDGVRQWEKTYGGTGFDRAWDIEVLPDGFLVFGSRTMDDGSEDFLITRLSGTGTVYWEQNLSAGPGNDRGFAMRTTSDGGWIVAGSSDSKGAGGRDIWVVKYALAGPAPSGTGTAPSNVTPTPSESSPGQTAQTAIPGTATPAPTTRAPLGLAGVLVGLGAAGLIASRRR